MILNKIKSKKKLILITGLLILFSLPNNNSFYFNGLPFDNFLDYLIILFFFPIFFWSKVLNSISKKFSIILIIALILKTILTISPQNGELIKQYGDFNQFNKNKFIPSINTFWNDNITFLKKKNWHNKKNFPIDWTQGSKENFNEKNIKYFKNHNEFENISLIYKSKFWIFLDKQYNFNLIANKLDNDFNNFVEITSKDRKYIFKPNQPNKIEKGTYEVNYQIKLITNNWSLYPILYDGNKQLNVYKKKIIFAENIENFSNNEIYFFFIIGLFFQLLIVTLIIYFLVSLFQNKGKILIYFFFQLIFFLLTFYLLKKLNYFSFDEYGSSILSILIIINFIFYKFIPYKIDLKKNSKLIFLFLIKFIVIIFFSIKNYELINANLYSWGDDWDAFRMLAREILLENDWLSTKEPVYNFRVLNRYLYTFFYAIFGSSTFIYHLSESVVIVYSSYFLYRICTNLKINQSLSIIIGLSLMIIFFGDNYRWLIGRALPEYYALFLILYSSYIFTKIKNMNTKNFLALILLGGLGVLFREDHGLMIISMFLLFNNEFFRIDKSNFLISIFKYIKKNIKNLFFYSFAVTFIFSLIFIRNYYVSGNFGLFTHSNLLFERDNILIWGRMFLGIDLPSFPRPYSFFLISGFMLSLLAIFVPKILNYNNSVVIIIISILIPYLFLNNQGYSPRYTIHFLPFCLIVNGLFYQFYLKKFIKLF